MTNDKFKIADLIQEIRDSVVKIKNEVDNLFENLDAILYAELKIATDRL